MKAFNLFTYKDAAALFTADRRTLTAKRAREFFNGNHWQSEWGYAGELPPLGYEGRSFIIDNLRNGFVFENVIFEVTDTHTGGVLGTEPMWDFVRNGEKLRESGTFDLAEALTEHWDERESLQILAEAAEGLVLEGASVLRLYFPEGLLGEGGTLPGRLDFADALTYLYSEVLTADVAGVFTDPKTKKKIGVYLFTEGEDNDKVKKADICYLDGNKQTVLRRLTEDKSGSDDFGPYDLGGHLFLHELKRQPLITDAVQTDQKAVNLAHTMMKANVNLAGNRTTDIINGRVPDDTYKAQTAGANAAENTKGKRKTYKRNPGWINEIWGLPIRNEAGKLIGYTQPSVNVTEPVDPESFIKTRDHYYAVILGQCFQRHVLISGDATVSGRSREQARKEYERSLNKTAVVLNAAGRWQLEVELRMAGELSKTDVSDLRAVFQCNVEKVPISAEERQENRADLEAGILDDEEVMRRAGVEDTGAMKKRVAAYQKEKQARQPKVVPPPPVEDKTGQGAIG